MSETRSSLARRLKLGNPAPDFTAWAAVGGEVSFFSLAEALKKGPVVLYFFPKAFATSCTAESHDFAEAPGRLTAAGVTLIGSRRDPAHFAYLAQRRGQ